MIDPAPTGRSPQRTQWWRFRRLGYAALYMGAHIVVALFLIGAITMVGKWLTAVGNPTFFDFIPQRYLYDLMDAVIVAVFGVYGVRDTVEVFRSGEEDFR